MRLRGPEHWGHLKPKVCSSKYRPPKILRSYTYPQSAQTQSPDQYISSFSLADNCAACSTVCLVLDFCGDTKKTAFIATRPCCISLSRKLLNGNADALSPRPSGSKKANGPLLSACMS